MGTRMSDGAWELAQERRANRAERTAVRRADRRGKTAERAMSAESYRTAAARWGVS